jgi:TatD DNase family protein
MTYDAHTHREGAKNALVNVFHFEAEKISLQKFCSFGIHPWHVENFDGNFEASEKFFSQKNVLAVGETGLDKLCNAKTDLQRDIFIRHIKAATQFQKPLIIHAVRTHDEIVQILLREKFSLPVVFHGFNQNENILQICLKIPNVLFSFGAAVVRQSKNALSALQKLPSEKILLETDDAPMSIEEIFEKAAETRGEEPNAFRRKINQNFQTVFLAKSAETT